MTPIRGVIMLRDELFTNHTSRLFNHKHLTRRCTMQNIAVGNFGIAAAVGYIAAGAKLLI